ncbi:MULTISPECIES: hypothetical protein [unclassified Brevibacterium]|uniref:hypothetical protein n=1 Tax=unclassified Brevibacterium TaxID=2614124 RepID=UPI00109291BB|nr:hypothetical protein [Brevibacterium sp. S22]TGD30613.1 hypothetical protein EB835_11810 [Brevibacterium sp. S22]
MRLPDIPQRHHRIVRTAATLAATSLALVRRRDVSADDQRYLRLGTALATGGLTWLTGTTAFLGKVGGSSGIDDFVDYFTGRGTGPVRYSTEAAADLSAGQLESDFDPEAWWEENADLKSPSFLNAAAAVAAGAAGWALWPVSENLVEAVDHRLPTGVGRGLTALISGGLVALTAAAIETVGSWADAGEETHWAPVEIELPAHIRESVDLLLSQPHPNSPETAEAVREQFVSAQFFVWVAYPDSLHSGDEPVLLDSQQLAQALEGDDIVSIDVRPRDVSSSIVPAMHTYPVTGIVGTSDRSEDGVELSLEIVDGRLNRIDLGEQTVDTDADMLTAAALRDSVPGTLHPEKTGDEDGAGYWSSLEITDGAFDEQVHTLETWPRPEELSIRVDGQ